MNYKALEKINNPCFILRVSYSRPCLLLVLDRIQIHRKCISGDLNHCSSTLSFSVSVLFSLLSITRYNNCNQFSMGIQSLRTSCFLQYQCKRVVRSLEYFGSKTLFIFHCHGCWTFTISSRCPARVSRETKITEA